MRETLTLGISEGGGQLWDADARHNLIGFGTWPSVQQVLDSSIPCLGTGASYVIPGKRTKHGRSTILHN